MFTVVAGFALGVGLLLYALSGVSESSKIYLDLYSMILVVGGTISAALMSVTWKNLKELGSLVGKAFTKKNYDEKEVTEELLQISEKAFSARKISNLVHESSNPFIQKGVRLLQSEMAPNEIRKILSETIMAEKHMVITNSEIVKMIAKYPPSFGMVGTILGLIAMLEEMSISSGLEKIGVKMAVALVTTLYGLLFANYVLIPLSEILVNKAQTDLKIKKTVLETFIIVATNKNDPVLVREYLGVSQQTSNLKGTEEPQQSEAA